MTPRTAPFETEHYVSGERPNSLAKLSADASKVEVRGEPVAYVGGPVRVEWEVFAEWADYFGASLGLAWKAHSLEEAARVILDQKAQADAEFAERRLMQRRAEA